MATSLLIFPNQLFAKHPGLRSDPDRVYLVEDSLFFGDDRYPAQFHKQKLWLHRASMKRYASSIKERGFDVQYIDYRPGERLIRSLKKIRSKDKLLVCDPCDFMLTKRLNQLAEEKSTTVEVLPNPGFLNSREQNEEYRSGKKRWFMADFYKWQRTRLDVLMDGKEPQGGKWSFDEDNRKKVPKQLLDQLPAIPRVKHDAIDLEARDYIRKKFDANPGSLETLYYPTSHSASANWLKAFLTKRFENFGVYEDAIVAGQSWLWHSVLTPMLNIGLLTPDQVLRGAISHAEKNEIPINSLEGFVRQIIGWREFMRATYEDLGVKMRTTNHWQHHRRIPASFYDGSTGLPPIDDTIRRILATGYCHHIERLMVLGGFMFLCEFDPDEIYRWFMEMFVDSYDWVMVPNAYAMSQHADGGLITTKPYFSGSAYVKKMSNHRKGDWCDIWDGLYWRWILNHVDELAKNPRWAMMCSTARRMPPEKQSRHLEVANTFLAKLDQSVA